MRHRASLLNRRAVPARALSCGVVPDGGRPIRVLVLTAPVGEGHVAAARVLAEEPREAEPERGGDRPRRAGRAPGAAPLVPERRLPLAADGRAVALRAALRNAAPQPPAAVGRAGRALADRVGSVLRLVRRDSPDVVVSTWPPDADPRLAASARQGARARVRDDHRFRRPRALGRQGRRPPPRDARKPRARRRARGRARQRVVRLPARGPGVPRTAGGCRGPAVTRPADRREGRRRLRRRLGRGRPRRCGHGGARARCDRRLPRRTRRGGRARLESGSPASRACGCSASPTR